MHVAYRSTAPCFALCARQGLAGCAAHPAQLRKHRSTSSCTRMCVGCRACTQQLMCCTRTTNCASAGVVESIAPMRTLIRSDQKLPVYINNKVGCL